IPNDEVASLAALHLSEIFEINDIFQLPARSGRQHAEGEVPQHLRGHLLFGGDTSCTHIRDCLDHEHDLYVTEAASSMTWEEFAERFGEDAAPLFLVRGNQLIVFSEEEPERPRLGDQIIMIAREDALRNQESTSSAQSLDQTVGSET
ncbi:MAG: hypothetical protein BRD30_04480, partial [Bacteroidetes bacterium QH_2_63_10]